MATSVQTPAEALHALLVPSTREGLDAIENNAILKRASNVYKESLGKDNVDTMRSTLYTLADELQREHLFDRGGDEVTRSFNFEPYEMRVETPAESQEISSSMESSRKKESEKKSHGGGGTTDYDRTNTVIKEKVQGSVRKEFEKLLATTKPDDLPQALEQFYHTHLSASGILGSQYQVLLDKSKELYGGKEEFEKHSLALKGKTDSRLGHLEDVHTFGPSRPIETEGKTKEQIEDEERTLKRQKEIEEANLRNFQMIAQASSEKDRAENLRIAMETFFDKEWERREKEDALLNQFVDAFRVYRKNIPRDDIFKEFGTGVVAVTLTQQAYAQERGTTQVTQGPTFTQQQSGGSNVASNMVRRAKDVGNRIRKKLIRESEEEIAKKAVGQAALNALRSGFSALISALGGWPVVGIALAIIAGVLLLIILIVLIVSVLGGNQQQQQQQGTPIPGLTLSVSYPGNVQNGQNIPYVIDVRYDGTDSITITDSLPANTNDLQQSITGTFKGGNGLVIWNLDNNTPLSDSTSVTKHYQFKITLQPTQKDIQVTNTVTATYTYGGPSQSGGGSGPTAGGYCSPSNLATYFGSAQNGRIASCICKYESGGDPGAENKACLRGGTADYSIGLFQINLIAHCSGALVMHGNYCSVADARTLSRCTLSMMDPVNNINQAVAIFHGANGFAGPWAAEKGKCF